jgi:hypothetical protein
MAAMQRPLMVLACLAALAAALAVPALAANYPVSGRWGQSDGSQKGAIDCTGKRVIAFNGNQRTDSNGGVPAYRNRSVTAIGQNEWRVVDEFTNGQVSDAQAAYTLIAVDSDHLTMQMHPGGTLKLQRCK